MNFDEFCELVGKVFDSIPANITDGISLSLEDYPTKGSIQIMQVRSLITVYGFWNPLVPKNITLCYWGFNADNDFSESRIESVIKHEIEHLLKDPLGMKHSEHS